LTTDILMPRLSDTMESGIVGRWLRSHGEFVKKDDPIVEIETDKVTTELVAASDGYLAVLVAEGHDVPAGGVVARIVPGPDELDRAGATDGNGAAERSGDPTTTDRTRATPVARKLAREANIDLGLVGRGSGPDGRIHRIDIERFLAAQPIAAPEPAQARDDSTITPTRVQRLVAERTTRSKHEVPHYYVTTVADASEALELKRRASSLAPERQPSVTDFVAFACARALRAHPRVNASWSDGQIIRRGDVNIGIAVALEDDELVVPVIPGAHRLSLPDLANRRRELTQRAREGKLVPDDLAGATFTISNLGTYGVTEFHAIVNQPESGILAIGRVEEQVVVHNGQMAIRPRLSLSLSADHRVYSGAAAASFLSSIRDYLEHPGLTLLEVGLEV
jgi:pyruvate dehydrogenase E2 component (dihydrolipoamide acetyltransferase)